MLYNQRIVDLLRRDDAVALATVIRVSGGSSKRLGARAIVMRDGQMVGSLTSGGCVDAEAARVAERVIESGCPETVRVELGEGGMDFGMSCAGSVGIFVEPLDPIRPNILAAFERVSEENSAGRAAQIAVHLDDRTDRYTAFTANTTADELTEFVREVPSGGAQLLPVDGADLLVEHFASPSRLIVVGASPIADPLVRLGKMLGFQVVLVASREIQGERFSEADMVRSGMPSEICLELDLDANSFIVICAHDYKYEVPVLRELVSQDLAYLGFVASRRRGAAVIEFLRTTGTDPALLQAVHVPVGLDVGAVTPEEIAVSISAELLAIRSGRPGGSMRMDTPEYAAAEKV